MRQRKPEPGKLLSAEANFGGNSPSLAQEIRNDGGR